MKGWQATHIIHHDTRKDEDVRVLWKFRNCWQIQDRKGATRWAHFHPRKYTGASTITHM